MEKRLKNLDKSALQDITLTPVERASILQSVTTKQKKKTPFRFYFSFVTVLAIASILAFSFSTITTEPPSTSDFNPIQEQTEKPIPAAEKDLSAKGILLDKILNSVDYYDTARGVYEVGEDVVTFQWDLEQGKCYEKISSPKSTRYTVCDGSNIYSHSLNGMEESKYSVKRDSTRNQAQLGTNGGILQRRDIPPINRELIYPQSLLAIALGDKDTWTLREESESSYGRSIYVVSGILESSVTSPAGEEFDRFHFFVDKETGSILGYHLINGDIFVQKAEITEIEFQVELDERYFSKEVLPSENPIIFYSGKSHERIRDTDNLTPIDESEIFKTYSSLIAAQNNYDAEKIMTIQSKEKYGTITEDEWDYRMHRNRQLEAVEEVLHSEITHETGDEVIVFSKTTYENNEKEYYSYKSTIFVFENGQWMIYKTFEISRENKENHEQNIDLRNKYDDHLKEMVENNKLPSEVFINHEWR
ncbi:hypothetical protein [Sutcliffiella horikoshii]|uniref:hypothetical protein n=1 Tax=Sutcliffiella horikoshii TaxID=79883 RepID=UPI00384B811D